MKMIKKILSPFLTAAILAGAFATVGTISGCNTIEGAGKDVEHGGRAIKEEARETKEKM
jgi:entericidin B